MFLLPASTALQAAEPEKIDFERDIAGLLEARCIRCHNPNHREGDLSLATPDDLHRLDLIVPGDAEASSLYEVVAGSPGSEPTMPKEDEALTPEQVDRLRRWIRAGAVWPAGFVIRERSKAGSDWWSFQPLRDPVVPPIPESMNEWALTPIDRFVGASLAQAGLQPNPPADRRTLIRRATYDLTGLPPTPEQIEAFVHDRSPDAYGKLIDRLLASPHYGERWGRHWLDVIRFGESRGFERNEIINTLWPLRDYVINAFNADKPFDQLIREHVAGDVFGKDQPDIEVASAFLVSGPYDDVGNQDPAQAAQIRADIIDEIIRASSEAFLGITLGCARCHDHKFDPLRQSDYYAWYGTFAGIRHGEREVATLEQRTARDRNLQPLTSRRDELASKIQSLRDAIQARAQTNLAEHEKRWPRPAIQRTGVEETFPPVKAKAIKLVVEGQEANPASRTGYRIQEFEAWTAEETARNVAIAEQGAHATGASSQPGDFATAYSAALTIDGQFGSCWIAASPELIISFAQPETIQRVFFSSDRRGETGTNPVANFVSEYRLLVSEDGQAWHEVANSHDRQPMNEAHRTRRLFQAEATAEELAQLDVWEREQAALNRKIASIPALPVWWVGTRDAAKGPFHLFLGGSPARVGDEVTLQSIVALDSAVAKYQLSHDADETQRRVALADWIASPRNPLTSRVIVNRLWHYHFGVGIVDTPSDFGFMGGKPSHPELLDWLAKQLLHHDWQLKPLHRLIMMSQTYQQSSQYRDAAANIDADSRWLWRYPPQRLDADAIRDTLLMVSDELRTPMGGPGFRLYQYLQDNVATYVPLDDHGPDTYRRAVYHQHARASRTDLMSDFDSPDCAFSTPRRAATITPLQALTMMNHRFVLAMSESLAARLQRDVGTDADALVKRAFLVCYGRSPNEDELRTCTSVIEQHGLPALCRALLNTSELIYLP